MAKIVNAGVVQWKLYEDFEQHFIDSGNSPFFTCDNKGCDPLKPIALKLGEPNSVGSNYSLTFDFPMDAKPKSGRYSLTVWAQDQDHFPYDMSVSLTYQY